MATIAAALVVLVMGAILVGTALARTAPGLRWPGIGYAVSLTIFSFSGVLGFGAGTQPVAGLLLAASTVLLARRLPRVGPVRPTVGRELTWASSLRRSW